jgi:hypothetical protein
LLRPVRAKQVRRPEAVNRQGGRFSGNPGPEAPRQYRSDHFAGIGKTIGRGCTAQSGAAPERAGYMEILNSRP